jgi:hypothetical protein
MKPKHTLQTFLLLAITIVIVCFLEHTRRAGQVKQQAHLELSTEANLEPSLYDFILFKSVIKHLTFSVLK